MLFYWTNRHFYFFFNETAYCGGVKSFELQISNFAFGFPTKQKQIMDSSSSSLPLLLYSSSPSAPSVPSQWLSHNAGILRNNIGALKLKILISSEDGAAVEIWKLHLVHIMKTFVNYQKRLMLTFKHGSRTKNFESLIGTYRKKNMQVLRNAAHTQWESVENVLSDAILDGVDQLTIETFKQKKALGRSSEKNTSGDGKEEAVTPDSMVTSYSAAANRTPIMCKVEIPEIANMVNKTHKSIVIQHNIINALDTAPTIEDFFHAICPSVGLPVESFEIFPIQYTNPPDLPNDILNMKTRQSANHHAFTTIIKQRKRPRNKSIQSTCYTKDALDAVTHALIFCENSEMFRCAGGEENQLLPLSSQNSVRYIMWPPKQTLSSSSS